MLLSSLLAFRATFSDVLGFDFFAITINTLLQKVGKTQRGSLFRIFAPVLPVRSSIFIHSRASNVKLERSSIRIGIAR